MSVRAKILSLFDRCFVESSEGNFKFPSIREIEDILDGFCSELFSDELLEKLAALEHEQWAHWIKYEHYRNLYSWRMKQLKKWLTKAKIPYSKLTEEERESDREWARKALEIFKADVLALIGNSEEASK